MALDDDALTRALVMAGLGMMGSRGNTWDAIARGGMFGVQGYDQAQELAEKRKLVAAKLREEELQAQQKEAALARAKRMQEILGGASVQPAGSQRSVVDAPGWTPQVAPAAQRNIVEDLLREGFVDEAKKYGDAQRSGVDEVFSDVRVAQDGTPFLVTKSGKVMPLPKTFALREKAHFADTGSSVVPLDQFTGKPIGEGVRKTMSPAEAAAERRAQEPKPGTYDPDRGVVVDTRTSRATPVTDGGGAPIGPKPQKLGAEAEKQVRGVENTRNAITEYRQLLKKTNPADWAMPNKRAEMGTVYNNMLLQAKEAYALGVLNGPDYQILQEVITNPNTMKGIVTSRGALDDQAKKLDELLKRVGQVASGGQQPQGGSGGGGQKRVKFSDLPGG